MTDDIFLAEILGHKLLPGAAALSVGQSYKDFYEEPERLPRFWIELNAMNPGLDNRRSAANGENTPVPETLTRPSTGIALQHLGQSITVDHLDGNRLLGSPVVEPPNVLDCQVYRNTQKPFFQAMLLVRRLKRIANLPLLGVVPRFGEEFTLVDAYSFTLRELVGM